MRNIEDRFNNGKYRTWIPPGDGPESCYPPAEDFVNTPSDLSLGLDWAGLG